MKRVYSIVWKCVYYVILFSIGILIGKIVVILAIF